MTIKLKFEEEYYVYLDGLESGVTNMYGAAPFLVEEFDLDDKRVAREILQDWMDTFAERHPDKTRLDRRDR